MHRDSMIFRRFADKNFVISNDDIPFGRQALPVHFVVDAWNIENKKDYFKFASKEGSLVSYW